MSNTVIIWVVLPIALGLGLILLQKMPKLSTALASLIPLVLALLALIFSESLTLQFLGRRFILADSLTVFGRTIEITADQLRMIALLYTLCFFWNLLGRLFDVSQWSDSLSLVITSLWVSVQFINPFLYSAVIIELIALISVPLLSPRGTPAKAGIIRFLSMQTIAMPLILLSGWMVAGIETSPSAQDLVLRGALLVLTGFILWAGVFPLHSWLPMLTEESHPWTISFLLTIMQISIALFFLKFLNQYAWLRNIKDLDQVLKWVGALCLLSAGVMAVFQRNLSRVLGYLYLAETGYIVLSIASIQQGGLELFILSLLPRSFAFWSLGFALSALRQEMDSDRFDFSDLSGLIWRYPLISILLLASLLNIIGLPLFALFPSKRIIWSLLTGESLLFQLFGSLGLLGMIILFLRLLGVMISPSNSAMEDKQENPIILVPVMLIVLTMVMAGIFPHIFSAPVQDLLVTFQNLMP